MTRREELQEAYEDAVRRMPKNESFVETPEGVGTVSQVNLLKETVKVRLEEQPEAPKCFHNCEICVVRNGKGKLPEGYVPPPPEELAKLRKITPVEEPHRLSGSVDAALSGLGVAPAEPEPSAEPAAKKPAEEGRQTQPPRQKQKGEQQRPPRPEKQPKAPAAPSPASDGTAAPPTGEKKRPHRRRYRGKPKGDRPQGPKPES